MRRPHPITLLVTCGVVLITAIAIGTGIAAAQPDDGEGTPITGDAPTKAEQ